MGIAVRGLNGEQARERDMEENEGVLVTKVEAESPAQLKGIRPGDVITEVDHQRVTTPEEFHKAMGAANPEAGVVVIVVSEGTQEFLVLREIGD